MKSRADIKCGLWLVALCALLAPAVSANDYHYLFTGEVFSRSAQGIYVPRASGWRSSISMLAPEGQQVAPGDVVARFDGTDTQRELETLEEARRSELAVTDRDLARLEKEVTQAEMAVELADVALNLARMRADLPEGLIGAIEHSENQLAREQTTQDLQDAIDLLEEKKNALEARRNQAQLDARKFELKKAWSLSMLDSLSVAANQAGYVIHANHPETRAKFQQGDSVRTSFRVAEVADTSDLAIRVWVNGVDRPHVGAEEKVRITFDALPNQPLTGRLDSISDSATKRLEWGKAAYFEGVVSFDAEMAEQLKVLPGMSALVEVLP